MAGKSSCAENSEVASCVRCGDGSDTSSGFAVQSDETRSARIESISCVWLIGELGTSTSLGVLYGAKIVLGVVPL